MIPYGKFQDFLKTAVQPISGDKPIIFSVGTLEGSGVSKCKKTFPFGVHHPHIGLIIWPLHKLDFEMAFTYESSYIAYQIQGQVPTTHHLQIMKPQCTIWEPNNEFRDKVTILSPTLKF